MSRLLARLLQPLEAALVLAFYGLFSLLPPVASSATGAWLLRRICPLIGAHRIARRNLERTYPDHPASEIDGILDGMWANLGRNIGEFPHLKTLLANPDVVEVG